jgi:pimeloyl-ACP methyl ester carboxylesterase
MRHWYQWYFNTERGRNGLTVNREGICRLLWQLWSPNWRFDDATFARSAESFQNPDFVDVVIQSYRHRHRAAPGDPALEAIELLLETQPSIAVPAVVLHGLDDGVGPPSVEDRDAHYFTGKYVRELVPIAGHFFPREAPAKVVDAIRSLARG